MLDEAALGLRLRLPVYVESAEVLVDSAHRLEAHDSSACGVKGASMISCLLRLGVHATGGHD